MGLLDPPNRHSRPLESSAKLEAQNRKEKYYRKLITTFECSGARILFKQCDERATLERRMRLGDIFRSTGDLISSLWSQKVYIDVVGLDKLLKERFQIDSNLFEAHPVHKLEEGDTGKDGMPIQMVVEPAIIAWGNEKGECYDHSKVWAKAVVWMSSSSTVHAYRSTETPRVAS